MNSSNNRDAIVALLKNLGACNSDPGDAIPWARSLPADTTPEAAWNACQRGDWLVWMLGRLHKRGTVTRQTLVIAACAAARTALVHLKGRESEAAAVAAIETAERWTRREATLDVVRAARDAAWDARRTELAAFADAAEAAFDASVTAAAAATAFDADAFDAAFDAAASFDNASRASRLAEIATAVRASVTWPTVAAALGIEDR